MKKVMIITASALLAAGLLLFTCAFAAAGFDIDKLSTMKVETNIYTVSQSFTKIDIDTGTTDITFAPASDGACRVECVERDKLRHSVTVENGTLKIAKNDSRAWYERLTFSFKSLKMTVYLPEKSYELLTVDGGTGEVTVPEGFTFGSADIDISTGSVNFAASVKGDLKIETSTGSICLDGVTARNIDLDASTGSIKLKDTVASGDLNIDVSTGSVRFDNSDAGTITVDTSTGSVSGTLRTPKIFYAKSSTGSVSVPESLTGGMCKITTSTGSIDISVASE